MQACWAGHDPKAKTRNNACSICSKINSRRRRRGLPPILRPRYRFRQAGFERLKRKRYPFVVAQCAGVALGTCAGWVHGKYYANFEKAKAYAAAALMDFDDLWEKVQPDFRRTKIDS